MKLLSEKKNLKGFFIALAVCLVAIGGVVIATLQNKDPLPKDDPTLINNTTSKTSSPTKAVDKIITDIPAETEKTTKTPTTTAPVVDVDTKPATLFVLPLSNEVAKEFSDGTLVYSKTMQDWRAHNGVDFTGKDGQEVKVLADGKITSIIDDKIWGNTVIIDHGFGILTKYCGVITTLKAEDNVKVGDVLGTLTTIPCESEDAPHLHIEITVNGEFVNAVEAIGVTVKYTEKEKELKTD